MFLEVILKISVGFNERLKNRKSIEYPNPRDFHIPVDFTGQKKNTKWKMRHHANHQIKMFGVFYNLECELNNTSSVRKLILDYLDDLNNFISSQFYK